MELTSFREIAGRCERLSATSFSVFQRLSQKHTPNTKNAPGAKPACESRAGLGESIFHGSVHTQETR